MLHAPKQPRDVLGHGFVMRDWPRPAGIAQTAMQEKDSQRPHSSLAGNQSKSKRDKSFVSLTWEWKVKQQWDCRHVHAGRSFCGMDGGRIVMSDWGGSAPWSPGAQCEEPFCSHACMKLLLVVDVTYYLPLDVVSIVILSTAYVPPLVCTDAG